ncbi:Gypsy retrotransposon integrase-like protein 1, partial [Mucuna pruriens]
MMTGSPKAKISGGWLLSVDRASNQAGSGVGVILEGLNGVLIEQSLHFELKANNNQAEYEALLAEIRLAKELEAKVLTAKSDSKLMTRQVNGEYQARDPQLVKYLDRTIKLAAAFEKFTLHHKRGVQKSIIHKSIGRPTTKELEVGCIEERTTWMSPLMAYLRDEIKPEDLVKVKKLIKEAARYIIIGGELHRKGFSFPLLRCIEGEEARYVIKEVHEGLCGSHIEGQALVSKIAMASYYWPTLKGDCMDYVRRCDKCQRFAEVGNAPLEQLCAITSSWPFHKLGVDILRPFPPALGQLKYLIVAIDYFTKWIEAEPVTTISAKRIKRFYWKKIICRFGLPAKIVLDNGTQGSKQGHPKRTSQGAGRSEGKMGRRTPPSPLVLSQNSSLLYQRNTFSPHLRYRGSHLDRNQGAVTMDRFISTGRIRGRNKSKLRFVTGGAQNSTGKSVCRQGSSLPTATMKISRSTLPIPRLSPKKDNQNGRWQQAHPNMGGSIQNN